MKKTLMIVAAVFIGVITTAAQNESINPETLDAYVKTTDGLFYVIVPLYDGLIDEAKANVTGFNEQKGLISLRVSSIRLDDFQLGLVHYLTIRRFDTPQAAEEYIDRLQANAATTKLAAMIISQANYRKFFKNKDLEAYKRFLGSN